MVEEQEHPKLPQKGTTCETIPPEIPALCQLLIAWLVPVRPFSGFQLLSAEHRVSTTWCHGGCLERSGPEAYPSLEWSCSSLLQREKLPWKSAGRKHNTIIMVRKPVCTAAVCYCDHNGESYWCDHAPHSGACGWGHQARPGTPIPWPHIKHLCIWVLCSIQLFGLCQLWLHSACCVSQLESLTLSGGSQSDGGGWFSSWEVVVWIWPRAHAFRWRKGVMLYLGQT